MVSPEEFDALRKRVCDLETIVTDLAKVLQGVQGALETQSAMVDENFEKTIKSLATLTSVIGTVQEQVEMLELG